MHHDNKQNSLREALQPYEYLLDANRKNWDERQKQYLLLPDSVFARVGTIPE
jgi:hypothetical protein